MMKRMVFNVILVAYLLIILAGCGGMDETMYAANETNQGEWNKNVADNAPALTNQPEENPEYPNDLQERQWPSTAETRQEHLPHENAQNSEVTDSSSEFRSNAIVSESTPPIIGEIIHWANGFSSVDFTGDDGLDAFLKQGGASSDVQVAEFLAKYLLADVAFSGSPFGCSTLAVKSPNDETLFGRNFDWQTCEALVVKSRPKTGYASISTVNMDFIRQGSGEGLKAVLEQKEARVLAALYAPLDGMNEKGLAVSVNMIEDAASIHQDTGKTKLTTTTAIRLLLDKAANIEEALALLARYDLQASLGMMVHFALADTSGRSVVVEYIDNQMVVVETPAVTNFYLAAGQKQGVGTQQSHIRYELLLQALSEQKTMDSTALREVLDNVSKDNFGERAATQWSTVFNLTTGEAQYYHRENYQKSFTFSVK